MPIPTHDDRPPLSLARDASSRVLEERHYQQLQELTRLARPARKAAGYAHFSGWATLLSGALSLPFTIGNIPMMVFCLSIAAIGTRELTLRRRLLELDASSPRKLAFNQLMLGGVLATYAIYMLMQPAGESTIASAASSDPSLQSVPEIAAQLDGLAQIEHVIRAGVYVLLLLIALLVQGGTAIYYACKARSLKRLHKRSPEWCVRVFSLVHA